MGPGAGLATVARAELVAIMTALRKKAVIVLSKFGGEKLLKRILVLMKSKEVLN